MRPKPMRARLISITVLAGALVASACATPYGVDESGDIDAGQRSQTTQGTEPVVNGSTKAPAKPDACPSRGAPVIAAWKPPPPVAAACTDDDFSNLAQIATKDGFTLTESLVRARNAACANCIFTRDTDLLWGPVVLSGTAGNGAINPYACHTRAQGGSEACGRGKSQWTSCYMSMCSPETCGGGTALAACIQIGGALREVTAGTAHAASPPSTVTPEAEGLQHRRSQ